MTIDLSGLRFPMPDGERLLSTLQRLGSDPLWSDEYNEFVHNVSFAEHGQVISLAAAVEATTRLANRPASISAIIRDVVNIR